MSSSVTTIELSPIRSVELNDVQLVVSLADGRTIATPLDYHPRLAHATPEERHRWELMPDGEGIEWPDLDEQIPVEGLIAGRRSGEGARSFARWLKVQEQLRLTSGYRRLRREVLNAGPLAADEIVRRVRRHIDAFEERYDDWLVGQHADPFVRLRQLKVGENEDAVMVFEAVDTAAAAAAVTGCLALGLQSDTGGSPESSSYVFVLRQKRI